jgi:hypothetical protein
LTVLPPFSKQAEKHHLMPKGGRKEGGKDEEIRGKRRARERSNKTPQLIVPLFSCDDAYSLSGSLGKRKSDLDISKQKSAGPGAKTQDPKRIEVDLANGRKTTKTVEGIEIGGKAALADQKEDTSASTDFESVGKGREKDSPSRFCSEEPRVATGYASNRAACTGTTFSDAAMKEGENIDQPEQVSKRQLEAEVNSSCRDEKDGYLKCPAAVQARKFQKKAPKAGTYPFGSLHIFVARSLALPTLTSTRSLPLTCILAVSFCHYYHTQ